MCEDALHSIYVDDLIQRRAGGWGVSRMLLGDLNRVQAEKRPFCGIRSATMRDRVASSCTITSQPDCKLSSLVSTASSTADRV
jgi:hypothetical protein